MEIKTKFEIGQHIWVVYENRDVICLYDTTIDAINYDKDGLSYFTKECNDYKEEQIILYEETDLLLARIIELSEQINRKIKEKE